MYVWIMTAVLAVPVQEFKITKSQEFVIVNNQDGGGSKVVVVSTLPKFIDVPEKYQRMNDGSVLADILNRTDRPSYVGSRATTGHETTHQLNAQLRNERGGSEDCCFYVLKGKAGHCREPRGLRKHDVAVFIPQSLRESRYRTYVQGAADWDDKPSYIAEEWSAYLNDTEVNLDDHARGLTTDQADCAMAPLEMGIYSVALCMAVEKYAPDSWANDAQFRAIMRYQWKRAKELFDKAAPLWPYKPQAELLNSLRTSPDAEAMRRFIIQHFDGVWLEQQKP